MIRLDEWWAGGTRVPLLGHEVFVRQDGRPDGSPVTLVHGYPTSSHDWAPILTDLVAAGLRVTTLDLLGFGNSDKPRGHRWSLVEQADIVEAVWSHLGVGETALVAHDYGVSVAQELLARAPSRVTRMVWMNGGVYPDLHRPTRNQKLLHSRLGPLLTRLVDEERYTSSLKVVLKRNVGAAALHDMWRATAHRDGVRVGAGLLAYIDERKVHAERWKAALETYPGPVLCVWGPADPVSGAHVLERLRVRLPQATFEVVDAGHYPQVEAADEVGPIVAGWLSGA